MNPFALPQTEVNWFAPILKEIILKIWERKCQSISHLNVISMYASKCICNEQQLQNSRTIPRKSFPPRPPATEIYIQRSVFVP